MHGIAEAACGGSTFSWSGGMPVLFGCAAANKVGPVVGMADGIVWRGRILFTLSSVSELM